MGDDMGLPPIHSQARNDPPIHETDPESQLPKPIFTANTPSIQRGADQTSLCGGSAFALVGKRLQGLFEFGKLSARVVSATIGIPLLGIGYLAGGVVLLTSTLVKIVGRLTMGGLGYAIGAAADLIFSTTNKAGAVSKIFSLPTDIVATAILIGYFPALITGFVGFCGAKLGLSSNQFAVLKQKTLPIIDAFKNACKKCDNEIERILHKKPTEDITSILNEDSYVRRQSIPQVPVFTPSPVIPYLPDSDPLFQFSADYLKLRDSALDYLKSQNLDVDWELSPNGGIIGTDTKAFAHSSPADPILEGLIGQGFTRSAAKITIANPFKIIELGTKGLPEDQEIPCEDPFTPEYREQQQKAVTYLNTLKCQDRSLTWKAEADGTLSFMSSVGEIKGKHEKIAKEGREEINGSLVNTVQSLKVSYTHRPGLFSGSISDPQEIDNISKLNEWG